MTDSQQTETTQYAGADAHIFKTKDQLCTQKFVVEHTILPKTSEGEIDIENLPTIIVSAGPGRSGSTGFAGLMASHPHIQQSYYQPWKSLIRHGDKYGDLVIPSKEEGVSTVFAKETFGPFHEEEEFDPVDLLIQAGYPPEKIVFLPLIRDPLATYNSNMKFEGEIQADILISNILYTIELYHKYKDHPSIGGVIPIAYDLSDGQEEALVHNMMTILGLEPAGTQFDHTSLLPVWDGGCFVPFESIEPEEHAEITGPTFAKDAFVYKTKCLTLEEFPMISGKNGAHLGQATQIYEETIGAYMQFLQQSAAALEVPIPQNILSKLPENTLPYS